MDYLNETLARAHKFEQMMMSEGWKLVTAYYTNKMADLTNRMFASDADITSFQTEVERLRGIRELLDNIDSDIRTLNESRQPTTDK